MAKPTGGSAKKNAFANNNGFDFFAQDLINNAGAVAVPKSIDPSKLVPNRHNKYTMQKDEEYLELLKTIEADGILNPIIVKPADEFGNYEIYSGHRRRQAALELGLKKVPIKVVQQELKESEEIAFIGRGNIGARQKYPYDNALQMKEFYEALDRETNLSDAERKDLVINSFGISSERTYYNYHNLSLLPEKVLKWGQDGFITRDEGLMISSGYKKEAYIKITENLFEALEEIISSADETEKKTGQIKERLKGYEKALKRKDTLVEEKKKAEKKATVASYVKKIDKAWSEDMVFPTAPKEREKTKEAIERTIERLMHLKEQL